MTALPIDSAGEVSALVQQFLLYHGATYHSRATEDGWKHTPVTLAVPPQPIDRLPLAPGPWVVAPWDLPSVRHAEVWIDRLCAAGPPPAVVVFAMATPLLSEAEIASLGRSAGVQVVALSADPPTAWGGPPARALASVFDPDMQRSMAATNPLTSLSDRGDPRDPEVFRERLRRAVPAARVTGAMIAVNGLVYAAMVLHDAAVGTAPGGILATVLSGFSTAALVGWGGNAPDLSGAAPWRLITAAFLHGNLLHIGMNLFALRQLGQTAERLLGSAMFAAVYLLAALGGSVASFGWHRALGHPAVSVGASGAVFGVLGATIGFAFARRTTVPRHVHKALVRSGGFFVVVNVALGLAAPAIDNAAHLGGLVVGALAGAALSRELPPAPPPHAGVRAAIVIAIGLLVAVGYRVALALG